jgi:predicted  nucleic acid-binding Zn-ribbon protein
MFAGMYAKLIGIALIIAAVLSGVMYVRHLQKEVDTLTAANVVLESKIKDQNDAVDALKKDADARVAAAQVAVQAAKDETVKAKKKATIIYKQPPSTPGDNCKSALDLVNGVTP